MLSSSLRSFFLAPQGQTSAAASPKLCSTSQTERERPAMGPGFLHTHYLNRFGCMATGNMIRELKLQLIVEFL